MREDRIPRRRFVGPAIAGTAGLGAVPLLSERRLAEPPPAPEVAASIRYFELG